MVFVEALSTLLLLIGQIAPVQAQQVQRDSIQSDNTLSSPSRVDRQGNTFVITGGTTTGTNLFHSFREFSVPIDGVASFRNISPSIANILSRVTGGIPSRINGLVEIRQTDGSISPANLFLLNPSGIIFGPRAALNVGGSFLATTSDRIHFADGTTFSTTPSPTDSLLAVSVPVGLQMGQTAGDITVRSTVPVLSDPTSPGGLQVASERTLALVGSNVFLPGGRITAPGGRVELASVRQGMLRLVPVSDGWTIDFPQAHSSPLNSSIPNSHTTKFGNIQLSQGAAIDTFGDRGGAIHLQGGRIQLTDGSSIGSTTTATATTPTGGTLRINAVESIALTTGSAFFTSTTGTGHAGSIAIDTPELRLDNGAGLFSGSNETSTGRSGNLQIEVDRLRLTSGSFIGSDTLGAGPGGNVRIQAATVLLRGAAQLYASTSSQVSDRAQAGQLRLFTDDLQVQTGAQIFATTFGTGDAGNLTVHARNIELNGVELRRGQPFIRAGFTIASGIFAQAESGASGNGGNLTIHTQRLSIRDGAALGANTYGAGAAGNVIVQARSTVTVSGAASARGRSVPSGLYSVSGGIPARPVGRIVNATGQGGNVTITTPVLSVQDQAIVAVSSINRDVRSAGAGRIIVAAQVIQLDNGSFNASTESGNNASIILRQVEALVMSQGSQITTAAGRESGGGTGGNIRIHANLLVATPFGNNDITANAVQRDAGNVMIQANAIGISPRNLTRPETNPQSDITATSERGISGDIVLSRPAVDPTQGLVVLPAVPLDRAQEIAPACTARTGANTFVVTGRGGLPLSPDDPLRSTAPVPLAWITPETAPTPLVSLRSAPTHSIDRETPNRETNRETTAIAEAAGWVLTETGSVQLVARSPQPQPLLPLCLLRSVN